MGFETSLRLAVFIGGILFISVCDWLKFELQRVRVFLLLLRGARDFHIKTLL